jgi:hypothetical protein
MKILIYIILIVAFLMFYQHNPVFAFVIIFIFFALYLFFRSRKKGGSSARGIFFSGKHPQQDNRVDDLITLVLIQQMFDKSSGSNINQSQGSNSCNHEKEDPLEKTKKEILELLEEGHC